MEIGHIHVLAADVEASKKFYQDTFGLEEIAVFDGTVVMRDDSGIDFLVSPAEEGQVQGQRMHFGFRQQSAAAVKEKFEELQAKGVKFKQPYMTQDILTIFILSDPDGNDIEVYHAAT